LFAIDESDRKAMAAACSGGHRLVGLAIMSIAQESFKNLLPYLHDGPAHLALEDVIKRLRNAGGHR
jgi:hypothetical protein